MMKSKRMILGSAIAAVLASSPVLADNHAVKQGGTFQDGLTENAYGAVSLGFGDVGLSDSALVTSFVYGKDLGGIATNLGAEVELTATLADAEEDVFGTTYEASYMSLGAYATYGYNLGQRVGVEGLDLFGKLGLAYNSAEIEGFGVSYDDSEIDVAYGIGVNYNLKKYTGTDQYGVRAEYADNGVADEYKVGISYVF